jgi:hypothetical protein
MKTLYVENLMTTLLYLDTDGEDIFYFSPKKR